MRRIAIIGGGFSGAALATFLVDDKLRQRGPGRLVYLIDRSGRFGPGLAYSTAQPAHLLNVRAARMSLFPREPDDFVDWLRGQTRQSGEERETFAQRSSYGAYLEARLRRAAKAGLGGRINLARNSAISVRARADRAIVKLASGSTLEVDAVVLALGNLPAVAPEPFDGQDAPWFKADPWDGGALRDIAPHENVLLLGTGLTASDVVLALTTRPRPGRILALSRRGLSPRAHADAQSGNATEPLGLPLPLSEALHVLRREARAAEARGEPWQNILDRLRPRLPALWRRLPLETQKRFLRHARPWWDVHRHRIAPHVASWMAALEDAGRLRVAAGRVEAVEPIDKGVRVAYRERGASGVKTFEAACIVNCTGPCLDVRRAHDPLVVQLLSEGLARPHATGLGFDMTEEGRLIGAGGGASRVLYALGPLAQGALWETIAVPEIRARAHAMALTLAAPRPSAHQRR